MYRLDDKHLEKAKEIALHNRNKKNCGLCYERGYIGVSEENTLVICHKCVDMEKSMDEWKEYVSGIPELREQYADLFEEEEEEETEA